jgi:citrate synthase
MFTRTPKRKKLHRSELQSEGPLFISRDEALAALAIKATTLYTYVSRGLIRSIATPGSRQRLFSRADVEKILIRSKAHEGGAARAQSAMRFGEPIITTSITNVTERGPVYRGHSAIDLARSGVTFEAVAHLLWEGSLVENCVWPPHVPNLSPKRLVEALHLQLPPQDILKLFSAIVLALGLHTPGRGEECEHTAISSAQEIIQTLACCIGFLSTPDVHSGTAAGSTIATTIALALRVKDAGPAATLINAALIVCADMELTSGTFAARVAASAGSDIYACVAAGISAHAGGLSGISFDSCEDFLLGNERTAQEKLCYAREQGQRLPGFYYRIFPEGDPRGKALIDVVRKTVPLSDKARSTLQLIEQIECDCEVHAGIAAALVFLATALGLPRRAATALWAVGRVAGQAAHVIEQRNQGFLMRPRAKYETPLETAEHQRAVTSN